MTRRRRYGPRSRWSTPSGHADHVRAARRLLPCPRLPGAPRRRRGRAGGRPRAARAAAATAYRRARHRRGDAQPHPGRARAIPQLVRHDRWDYHLHATARRAPFADRIAVETAMAMVDVVRADELSRLVGVRATRPVTASCSTSPATARAATAARRVATGSPSPPTGPGGADSRRPSASAPPEQQLPRSAAEEPARLPPPQLGVAAAAGQQLGVRALLDRSGRPGRSCRWIASTAFPTFRAAGLPGAAAVAARAVSATPRAANPPGHRIADHLSPSAATPRRVHRQFGA